MNTFNFNRFAKLLGKELKEYPRRFGYSILGVTMVYLLYRAVFLFFPNMGTDSVSKYLFMVYWILVIILIVVPSKCYGTANHRTYGVDYALLPASAFEKMLSMFVVNYVVSLVSVFVCLEGVDLAAYLINPERAGLPTVCYLGSGAFVTMQLLSLFLLSAEFSLGNMLFSKNKISKTILCLFAIGAFFAVGIGIVISHIGIDTMTAYLENWFGAANTPDEIMNLDADNLRDVLSSLTGWRPVRIFLWGSYLYNGVCGLLCWFFTYRMIKTVKY